MKLLNSNRLRRQRFHTEQINSIKIKVCLPSIGLTNKHSSKSFQTEKISNQTHFKRYIPLQLQNHSFKINSHLGNRKYHFKMLSQATQWQNKFESRVVNLKEYDNKYKIDEIINKSKFSTIYKAHTKGTGIKVAIKCVLQNERYKNRQLQILKMVKHQNILQMKDHFFTYNNDNKYLNIVTDIIPTSLSEIIQNRSLNSALVKIYSFQILKALEYLSELRIVHRDIKPENILINPTKNTLFLCDFGSAKQLILNEPNLSYITSRSYRAPQLIFNSRQYTSQIDMWSFGCVLVEMINSSVPFDGKSQMDQLVKIIEVLGTPSTQDVQDMNRFYDQKELIKLPKLNPVNWSKILRTFDSKLIDIITKILVYSPKTRLTPSQAINHPYFDDIRNKSDHQLYEEKFHLYPRLSKDNQSSNRQNNFSEVKYLNKIYNFTNSKANDSLLLNRKSLIKNGKGRFQLTFRKSNQK